jgi:hypothetical protein
VLDARRWRAEWAAFPPLARTGVIVIVIGTVADVIAHTTAPSSGVRFTPPQQAGHLAILVGMIYTLAGVLFDALRSPSRSRSTASKPRNQGGHHAHR